MLPLLHLGPLTIQTPGLILLLGIWLGLSASDRYAKRLSLDANRLDNLVLTALLAGIIGARLGFAARNLSAFAGSPLDLLSLNPSMLDPAAGLLAGILAGIVYAQKKQMPTWLTLDALTPGLAILMVAFGLAHLASGDAFGGVTKLPWGIELWGEKRHPSQIYEIVSALLILTATWPGSYKKVQQISESIPGTRFLAFVGLTALARLFLEAFRGDSVQIAGGIRTAQVAAWIVLAAAIYLLRRRFNQIHERR